MDPTYGKSRNERIALAVPCMLYVLCVLTLGNWIIDDAGISFAYARNIAHLHGFVSQPGRVPVEGYSNFTWVMLLVPSFWLHVFHPVIVPKLLGALEVFAAFFLLQRVLHRKTDALWPGVVLTSLLALSPPIVIWTASGLENGLLLLLVTALFTTLVEQSQHWQIKAGVVAALIAMTRPDGLAFFALAPLALLNDASWRRDALRDLVRGGARYFGGFFAFFGPFFAFRLAVFGLPWPHTYYAKRGFANAAERLHAFFEPPGALAAKLNAFAEGLAGTIGVPLLVLTVIGAAVLAWRGALRREIRIALILQLIAVAAYVWLDDDWMGEFRFATPSILACLLSAALISHALLRERPRVAVGTWALGGAIMLYAFAPRLVAYAAAPSTPYDLVEDHAHRFNRYAEQLGVRHGSLLTPDLGGELMDSKLTIYDAAGLCEPAVVQLLKQNTHMWLPNHPRFYDWVFETTKPTFISTRGFWTMVLGLERDPRFARDYVAINQYADGYVRRYFNARVHSGDFVRRDALHAPTDLERLQRTTRVLTRKDPWVVRIGETLGLAKPPSNASPAEIMEAGRAAADKLDWNRAATLFGRVMRHATDRRESLEALGDALDDAGRADEGRMAWSELLHRATAAHDIRRAARAALRLDLPARAQDGITMQRGLNALYAQSAPARAIEIFRELLASNPTHYGATYQLAVALDRDGRRDEAQTIWRYVLDLAQLYDDQATADKARQRLGVRN